MPDDASDDGWSHGNYVGENFLRVTPYDKPGRRALWMRFPPCTSETLHFQPDGSLVELKAGREGDDAHVLLKEGDVLTRETIIELIDVLLTAKFGLENL